MIKIVTFLLLMLSLGCKHDKDPSTAMEPSTTSQISGEIKGSTLPIADAGEDKNVGIYSTVILNGQNSKAPGYGILNYEWSFLSLPEGSEVEFATLQSSPTTGFTPDVIGDYLVQLVVTDENNQNSVDTVKVTAGFAIDDVRRLYPIYNEIYKKSEYETEETYQERVTLYFGKEPIRFFKFYATESYDIATQTITVFAGKANVATTDALYDSGVQMGHVFYMDEKERNSIIPKEGVLHVIVPEGEDFGPVNDPVYKNDKTFKLASFELNPIEGAALDGNYEVIIGAKFDYRQGMLDASLLQVNDKLGIRYHLVGDLKRIVVKNTKANYFLYDKKF